jgi:hypothetical protein
MLVGFMKMVELNVNKVENSVGFVGRMNRVTIVSRIRKVTKCFGVNAIQNVGVVVIEA